MIKVTNVYKSYGKVERLKGISFTAENGQVAGLLGRNGAGKTTTLRMLYALVKADLGMAEIDGVDVTKDPVCVKKIIGVLADSHTPYPRLTARENIRYFRQLHGM